MRVLNSYHTWNENHSDGWTDALATTDFKGGCVILDPMLPHWYPTLRQMMGPEFLICVRMYPESANDRWQGKHWNEVGAAAWAKECRLRLAAIPGVVDDPYVCISPANEQDLAVEGHPGAASEGHNNVAISVFAELWTWQLHWLDWIHASWPSVAVKYGTAPLAGGHEPPGTQPDSEYQLPEFRALAEEVDCLWDHGYCLPDGAGSSPENGGYWHGIRSLRPRAYDNPDDPGGLATQYPGKTIIRSEFGNFKHYDTSAVARTMRQYHDVYDALSKSGRYALVAPFIWNSGDEHWPNRIQPNGGLVEALKTMYRYSAADWPPSAVEEWEMTQTEAYLTDMWRRQGVEPVKDSDAFWAYAVKQAEIGIVIVPQASKDGNYANYSDAKYVVAYTLPVPLWCEKGVWEVHEGFPPNP